MRHLGTMGYLVETGPDEYRPTNFSKALSIPAVGVGYPCMYVARPHLNFYSYLRLNPCSSVGSTPVIAKLYEFARQTNYQIPTSTVKGVLQYAHNTDLECFEFLAANPQLARDFNEHMSAYRLGRPSWMDPGFYPVQERLVQGADADSGAVLLVDIGGGLGHDLDEFRRKHPYAAGRLVLQDLPFVIDQIGDLHESIERVPYNFHTEQPIKGEFDRPSDNQGRGGLLTGCRGARAYYLHSVLHDWPDDVSARILARVKEAMKPGYSRLLISENIIPTQKAHWETTALDIMMFTLSSARERTEAEWYHLIEDLSGLTITQIWHTAKGVESMIECELV